MPNPLVIAINVDVLDANGKIVGLNRALGGIGDATTNATKKASQGLSDLEKSAASAAITIRNQFDALGGAIKAALGVGLAEAARSALEVTANFQLAELGIAAFVEAGEDSKKVFEDLKSFALRSPLQFETILEASNQLLALETNAKDLIPTLGSLSTAMFAVTGGKDVPDKLKDVIRAIGQVRAAGALTGEELRQIRNAAIVTDKELARAFGVTTQEFKKAVADRAVPAEAVIQATLEAAELRFRRFRSTVEDSAKVAFSNFIDALKQAAALALTDYLPKLTDGVNSVSKSIKELATVVKENRGAIEASLKAITSVAIVVGLAKLGEALVKVRLGWTALSAAFAANPIGAALLTVAAALGALDAYVDATQEAEYSQIKLNLATAQHARVLLLVKSGKGNEELLKIGFSADQVANSYKALIARGYDLQKQLKALPADVKKFEESQLTKFKLDPTGKDAAEEATRRKQIIKESETYLNASLRKEVDGLERVREEYRQKLEEVKGVTEAERNIRAGFGNFLSAERNKQLREQATDLEKTAELSAKFYDDRYKQLLNFSAQTTNVLAETEQERLQQQVAAVERERDSQVRSLESLAAYTVEQKVAVEQARAEIEARFALKSQEARKAALIQEGETRLAQVRLEAKNEIDEAVKKFNSINEGYIKTLEERARLDALYANEGEKLSVAQEAALQERMRLIRIEAAESSAKEEAYIRLAAQDKLNERLLAINAATANALSGLQAETDGAVTAARENAVVRSAEIIQSNNLRVFEGLKRNVEGLFDAVVTRSKSFGEAIADAIKLPILAAFKEIVSTRIAAMLFEIFGGGKVGIGQGGQPSFSGGGISVNTSGRNILGRLLGIGGAGALGFGGIPGAPGGTSGFSGPVQSIPGLVGIGTQGGQLVIPGIGGAAGSSTGVKGIGASLSGVAGSLKGILASLGNLGRGGAVLGPGSNGGALAQSGVGGVAGGAMLLGGGLLGFLGLRRGGVSGLGLSIAGGALAGAKFGVAGALIGAGIGAVAGTIRLFIKGAEEKIVEKVKAAYGITISKSFARDPLLGIIKQTFGGDINVGIQSQQVRDLIELYAMSTGQSIGSLPRVKPISSRFSLSGGGLSQLPSYSNGQPLSLGQLPGSSNPAPQPVVVQLDPDATTAFLQGQAVESINNNPRVVQGAVISASRQNAGRRQSLALAINPGVLL